MQKRTMLYEVAYEDGREWANNLAIGDRFMGARVEAMARGYKDQDSIDGFVSGGLSVLERKRVCTNLEGDLIDYRDEARGGIR